MELSTKKYSLTDKFGNTLLLTQNLHDGAVESSELQLKLAGQIKLRNIGRITYDKDCTLHVKRLRSKHLHNLSGSYGFNYSILSESGMFQIKRIRLTEEDTGIVYDFPKSMVEEYGRFLHFKQQGFEVQRFLSLQLIQAHRVRIGNNFSEKTDA